MIKSEVNINKSKTMANKLTTRTKADINQTQILIIKPMIKIMVISKIRY